MVNRRLSRIPLRYRSPHLIAHLPRMAAGFIDSDGKLHHTRRHLYPSVAPPSSPEMTTLSPRTAQMLIVLAARNGLVVSIN